jgi:CheY-like chemotaxis protein
MKILVVDDQTANRKLLRVQLEAEEYVVVESVDGAEALEILGSETIDAIISDILMPRVDGYRLCHEVRKHPALRHLPFILYSATYTSPADVRLANRVGADQFVAKPASLAIILAALQLASSGRSQPSVIMPDEAAVLQHYSSVLVNKLEEKNRELKQALEEAREGQLRIQGFNARLESRVRERTAELAAANHDLSAALAEVKQLNGLLPICSFCKRIRDGQNDWQNLEIYIAQRTHSTFSHGVCPECSEEHYAPTLRRLELESKGVEGEVQP